jgi:AraC-like DNA-binding protein
MSQSTSKPRSSSSRFPSVRLLRPLVAGAMNLGLDALEIFRRAGVDPQSVGLGTERIAPRSLNLAFELTAAQAGPDFGLRAIEAVEWRTFGQISGSSEHLFVAVVLTRANIREALEAAEKYSRIAFGDGGYTLKPKPGGVEVHFALEHGVKPSAVMAGFLAALLTLPLRQRTEHLLNTARFSFSHPRPPEIATWERLLGKNVTFGGKEDCFFVGTADLQRQLVNYQPEVAQTLMKRSDEALAELAVGRTLADEVRGVLSSKQALNNVSSATVATRLRISQRTMTRRLKAEGTSYQGLVDEHRARLAEHYLGVDGLTVAATAAKLGFSEASTFHRAFRRWFGVAPTERRRK